MPNGDMILLDGHNRFEIAAKHGGIHFDVKTMHFDGDDRNRAMAWMLRNQLGRRNISTYDRGVLALKLKPLIQAEAKKNQQAGGNNSEVGRQKSAQPQKTRDKLAEIADMSHDTIRKVEEIEAKASDATKQRIRDGSQSINNAWLEIKERERKQENFSARARLEEAKERHEDFQTAKTVTMQDIAQDKKDAAEIAESKAREIYNGIKTILFWSAAMSGGDMDLSVISKKNMDESLISNLATSITRAIDTLTKIKIKLESEAQ